MSNVTVTEEPERGQGWGTVTQERARVELRTQRECAGQWQAWEAGEEVAGLESVPDQNLAAPSSAAQSIPPTPLGSRTAFGEACRAPRSVQTK